jgi:CrcB protein
VAIAAGGVLGAGLRWGVVTSFDARQFPWPVLVLNATGSIVLGVLLAEEWSHPRARLLLHDLGAIGFCGGLTTFSTFSLEVVDLVRDGDTSTAVVYAVTSVISAVVGVIVGAGALRRLRSLTLPLEEEP